MKKRLFIIGFLALFPTHTVFAQGVKLLEGIKDIGAGSTPTLGEYITNGYTFAIGAAGVIAVVQLVIAGIEYIYFGFSAGNVSKAKDRATNTLYGLGAVLLSYLILQIINPAIVANEFKNIVVGLDQEIRKVEPAIQSNSTGIGGDTGQGSAGTVRGGKNVQEILTRNCPTCVSLEQSGTTFDYDGGVNKNVVPSLAGKLTLLNGDILSKGNWKITEAFPPASCANDPANCLTRHKHPCHRNGTCVDIALQGDRLNGAKVQAFADAAKNQNLFVEYEVQTEAQKQTLIKGGFKGCVKVLGSHISGIHFSVYNEQQSSC